MLPFKVNNSLYFGKDFGMEGVPNCPFPLVKLQAHTVTLASSPPHSIICSVLTRFSVLFSVVPPTPQSRPKDPILIQEHTSQSAKDRGFGTPRNDRSSRRAARNHRLGRPLRRAASRRSDRGELGHRILAPRAAGRGGGPDAGQPDQQGEALRRRPERAARARRKRHPGHGRRHRR